MQCEDRATCRFFFPWPEQPQQQYDENTERVALQRRCPEDDQWVVPHELYLAMFSPSTVNVLPFDPKHGADQARQYAAKYASKPEKWYYLETERDGVKDFLKCRTVGLCMAHNRLLNFHVVRSTRPVQFMPSTFVPGRNSRTSRDVTHKANVPDYPDPDFYVNYTQKLSVPMYGKGEGKIGKCDSFQRQGSISSATQIFVICVPNNLIVTIASLVKASVCPLWRIQ